MFGLFKKKKTPLPEITITEFIDRASNAVVDSAYGDNVENEYEYLRSQIIPLEVHNAKKNYEFGLYKKFLNNQIPEVKLENEKKENEFIQKVLNSTGKERENYKQTHFELFI